MLTLSRAAGDQLGSFLETAFQAGGELQGEMLDLAFGALVPGGASRAANRIATSTAETLRFADPNADGAAARQELRNKFEVYQLVRYVDRILGLPPPGEPVDLPACVERAYRHDTHRAMWLVEGLGHAHAARCLSGSAARPSGILTRVEVPQASRLMLHAGLGMALAEHLLTELSPRSSVARARRLVDEFVALCRANSRPGCEDAALESFGLMARCFYPDRVPILGRAIDAAGDETLRGYFWHGVGRGTYFVPVNFIPGYGSIWHAIEMSQREAPQARAAVSGRSASICSGWQDSHEPAPRVLRKAWYPSLVASCSPISAWQPRQPRSSPSSA